MEVSIPSRTSLARRDREGRDAAPGRRCGVSEAAQGPQRGPCSLHLAWLSHRAQSPRATSASLSGPQRHLCWRGAV